MLTRKSPLIFSIAFFVLVCLVVLVMNNFLVLQSPRNLPPRILELEKFRVRILWNTDKASQGQIWCGAVDQPEQSVVEKGKRELHIAEIGGLMPETVYNYRFEKESQENYSFKTASQGESAFRFLIYDQDQVFKGVATDQFVQAINTQLPDFIILSGQLATKRYIPEEREFFSNLTIANRIPIFIMPDTKDIKDRESYEYYRKLLPRANNGLDYAMDFGNSRFILLNQGFKAAKLSVKERGAWLKAQLTQNRPTHVFIVSPSSDLATELTRILTEQSAAQKIDAIFNIGKPSTKITGTKVIDNQQKYIVIDVDGAGVTGTMARPGQTEMDIVTIKETPEAVKRSCVYCRKLLDTQRFQESIDWYRKFIAEFGARYMVDDAQFEIANIYDQYLFDYPAALKEYQKLIQNYPNSSKVRQARQRIEYINQYTDFNFEPLRIFEKAKSQTYQRDKAQAVADVETIQAKYPGSKLEPQVLFWLGYTTTEKDLKKASSYFRQIIAKYPGQAITTEAWIGLGDAYYQHQKFHDSISAYESGLKSSGNPFDFGLLDKVRKSKRNILRVGLMNSFTLIILLVYLLAILRRPRYLNHAELKMTFYTFLVYLVGGVLAWGVYYRNYPELLRLIPILALVGATVPGVTAALARKYISQLPEVLRIIYTSLATMLLSAMVYLVFLYFYYQHYLATFGL